MTKGETKLTYEYVSLLMRCPVCLQSNKKMYMCCVGHNICQSCIRKIENCPICKGCFRGTRNFTVEALFPYLKTIKKLINQNAKSEDIKKKTIVIRRRSARLQNKKIAARKSLNDENIEEVVDK